MDIQLKRGLLDVCVLAAIKSEKDFMWQFVSADSLGCKREDAFNYKSFETEIMGEMHNYVLIYYVV